MGIFKDTYYVNENVIDNSGIEKELNRQNDIKEKDVLTKDRTNISLMKYEEMKETIKQQEEQILQYERFYNTICRHIILPNNTTMKPDTLVKGVLKNYYIEKKPETLSYDLCIVWNYEDF